MRTRIFAVIGVVGLLASSVACTGDEQAPKPKVEEKAGKGAKAKARAKAAAEKPVAKAPTKPVPSLIVVQAQFGTVGGKPKPLPAKLTLFRFANGKYFDESFVDQDANVFHKAMAWRGGILTIGAEASPKPAHLKHWTRKGDGWEAKTLWEVAWDGSKFNRMRDLEIGDVTGDGKDNLVIATHDRGVVAVGSEGADGEWTFAEFDEQADTFVHEIEIGDVDGDGKMEFYATPSERNKASGVSQPGSVYRYDFDGTGFKRSLVVDFVESHAKEILVTDIDGDGVDELYVVREAHRIKEDGKTKRVDPVRIVRYTMEGGALKDKVVATIDDDQCRFLLAGDVDHDGQLELIAAAEHSGLWLLEPTADGFENTLIDGNSGGFEHATHVADLDGDGKLEIYVAADKQKEFRRYVWNGKSFSRSFVANIGPAKNSHISWNIQDGVF